MAGLAQATALAESYPCKVVVGFDMHFDPGLMKVKELISEKIIGDFVSINATVGQYLPDWRPAEDYRTGMSARKETGGGVMLDLVHEFDYVRRICGPVQRLAAFYKNSGALQIETEDVAEIILGFQNGAVGSIHLDYLQPLLVRNCLVTGKSGSITWNLANNNVCWIGADKQIHAFDYAGFQRNQRFIDIMSAFMNDAPDERLTTLQQGIESLQLVLAAKISADEQRFISPGEAFFPA
jgi:predicted dehydrogenase